MSAKGKTSFYFNKRWEKVPKCIEYIAGRHTLVLNGYTYEEKDLRISILKANGFDKVDDVRTIHWKTRKELVRDYNLFVGKK